MSTLRRIAAIAGATALVLVVGVAPALAAPSDADAAWLASAHQSNLAEIAAGQSAQQNAASAGVRAAAATLIEDHTTLDADLRGLATELRITLPAAATTAQVEALARVETQSGDAYDAAWLALVIDGHAASLASVEQEAAAGSDPRVTARAAAAAPVIQRHYDHARALSGAIGSVPAGDGGQLATDRRPVAAMLGGLGVLLLAGALVQYRRRAAIA